MAAPRGLVDFSRDPVQAVKMLRGLSGFDELAMLQQIDQRLDDAVHHCAVPRRMVDKMNRDGAHGCERVDRLTRFTAIRHADAVLGHQGPTGPPVARPLRQRLSDVPERAGAFIAVSYTHLRAHETDSYLVCRLLLEK